MDTRQARKEAREAAFRHVMAEVLEFDVNSPVYKALHERNYSDISQLNTMSKEELAGLTYLAERDGDVPERIPVPEADWKSVWFLLLWGERKKTELNKKSLAPADWMALDADEFDRFVDEDVPTIVRGGSVCGGAAAGVAPSAGGGSSSGFTSNEAVLNLADDVDDSPAARLKNAP